MTFLFFLFVLFIVLGVVFIFPLWMLIHCAVSQNLPSTHKILWIIGILFFWPLGAYLYAVFGSRQQTYRILCGIILVLVILSGALLLHLGLNSMDDVKEDITVSMSRLGGLNHSELTGAEVDELKWSLQTLYNESFGKGWDKKTITSSSLSALFDVMADDGTISQAEYANWMSKFRSRELLDEQALKDYIRKLKMRDITDRRRDVQI